MTEMNGKAVKFRSLAERRVSKAIRAIRLIGNLSRRGSFDYTDAEVEKMFQAIHAELDEALHKFSPVKPKPQATLFTFD
jgi:hypothetical protein